MTNLAVAAPSADGAFARYLAEIRKLPVLEADEEFMLAKRWREHEDVEAAHRLVTSHLRLAAKIAMGYRHYGLPLPDLVSEGNVGLMRAVKKFDPEVGVRLSTYAMWWIKASLHEYLLNSWSLVKIGTSALHRKLFFNLRRLKARLRIFDSGELTPDQAKRLARDLGASEAEVVSMNRRIATRDLSLNMPVGEDGGAELIELIGDDADDQETMLAEREELGLRRRLLAAGLAQLDERERDIVERRHLCEASATLEEIGHRYGISRERVRQIEARALAKLKEAVQTAA